MRRSTRGLAAVVAVLALAGCGQVRPGAAATVDGEAIPLDRVDSMAQAFCAADVVSAELQDAEPTVRSMAEYRNRVLGTLINERLAADAVEELDLDVPESAYSQDLSQYDELFAELSAEDEDALRDYIEVFGRLQATTQAIGAQAEDAPADPSAAVTAGQQQLAEMADEADIQLDPRFGEMTGGQVIGGSGSLSVPAAGDQKNPDLAVDELPATQTCG